MSMIYGLRQAPDQTIELLLEKPRRILPFLGHQPRTPSRPGFLRRLFGAKAAPGESSVTDDDLPACDDLDHADLDKAWHGIHYLLTGSDWEGDPPAGFLLNWGTTVGDIDAGYGPARAFTSAEVAQIADYLAGVDGKDLRTKFKPQEMMEMDIYPTIWDRDPSEDDTLGYLLEYFGTLKGFVRKTAGRGYGMVVYLS